MSEECSKCGSKNIEIRQQSIYGVPNQKKCNKCGHTEKIGSEINVVYKSIPVELITYNIVGKTL